jgi:glycosyltransferase involved in cell wall biosynthesis
MSLDVGHSLLQTPLASTDSKTIDTAADRPSGARFVVVVAAHNEAARIATTLTAVREALPQARVWVADDGSLDATAQIAADAGARVACSGRAIGKGGAVTAAARAALDEVGEDLAADEHRALVFVLCDGDLGESARELGALADAVARGEADLAVGAFASRVGGGVGLARGFARWAIRRRCGLEARAPISGQRALSAQALADVLPFARGYGMEIGMTIDAVRAGHRVLEVELDLAHRATGRTLAGFAHRARQLVDFVRVYVSRRNLEPPSR